jgi:hypothetical protein
MTLDQFEYSVGRATGKLHQTLPQIRAKVLLDLARFKLETGVNLTAVPAGRAPSRLVRVYHGNVYAPFREMQRSGEPGESRANDENVCLNVPRRRRCGYSGPCGIRIQTAWKIGRPTVF